MCVFANAKFASLESLSGRADGRLSLDVAAISGRGRARILCSAIPRPPLARLSSDATRRRLYCTIAVRRREQNGQISLARITSRHSRALKSASRSAGRSLGEPLSPTQTAAAETLWRRRRRRLTSRRADRIVSARRRHCHYLYCSRLVRFLLILAIFSTNKSDRLAAAASRAEPAARRLATVIFAAQNCGETRKPKSAGQKAII